MIEQSFSLPIPYEFGQDMKNKRHSPSIPSSLFFLFCTSAQRKTFHARINYNKKNVAGPILLSTALPKGCQTTRNSESVKEPKVEEEGIKCFWLDLMATMDIYLEGRRHSVRLLIANDDQDDAVEM